MQKQMALIAAILGFTLSVGANENRDLKFSGRCEGADNNAVISFVGDILIHDALYKNVITERKTTFIDIWSSTNPLIQKADYSVANLEGPTALGLSSNGRDYGDVGFIYDAIRMENGGNAPPAIYSGTNKYFNFHPNILQDLKNSGYDLLTMANNHALDRGSRGVDKTLAAAKKVGISTVGTRPSNDPSAQFYHVASINGLGVAFISCTVDTNGMPDPNKQALLCYQKDDKIINMISVLKKHPQIDAVIVLPHWGEEYRDREDSKQPVYAEKFLNAGATAVIGSHPHVNQPWKKHITPDGRETLIAYSLGNFVAFQGDLKRKIGPVIYLSLSKKNGQTQVSGVGYTTTMRPGGFRLITNDISSAATLVMENNYGSINRVAAKESLKRFCK